VDEQEVFAYLKRQKKAVLLDYLHAAFDEMTATFSDAWRPDLPKLVGTVGAVDSSCGGGGPSSE
jgi:hypothetical protein